MAPLFKARLRMKPPKENCEQLHFAMMAFRGWRMSRFDQCVRAIRAYPRSPQHFNPGRERCLGIAGLGALVQSLKDAWYESEVRAFDEWEDDEKSKAKAMARLQHLRRAWSKMRRRYGLSGILDSSGQVCPSPTASAEAL
eukprot:4920933-Pyramimonas_sp.AAC.1